MEVKQDYDYAAEYAKSNRSQCKGCKSLIAKDSLRIALMVQSPFFDGKQPNWYHYSCFFRKCRPTNTDEIKDFNSLRYPDQEKIQAQIEGTGQAGGKGPKIISKKLNDFVVQYASSNRSTCRGCEKKIEKEEIRFSHKEKHPEKPQLGLVDRWHHVGCFLKLRKEMGWEDHFTAEMLIGFGGLDPEDKTTIRKALTVKGKKSKGEKETNNNASSVKSDDPQKEELKKKIKSQTMLMWKNIDKLKALDVRKEILIEMLQENSQRVPKGIDAIYLAIGDGMTFGALPLCTECKLGQLAVSSNGYHCTGEISEWTSCTYTTDNVERSPWIIPKYIRDLDNFLQNYKYKKIDRVFPPRAAQLPLKNKKILINGKLSSTKADVKTAVEKLGGAVTTAMSRAYFCISTKEEVQAMGKKMSDSQVQDVFVVSEQILVALQETATFQSLLPLLKKYSIADWGSEQKDRAGGKRALEEEKNTEAKKIKMVVKSGAAVDPESGLEDSSHVLVKGDIKYTATLSMVDMKHGSNSYYKLQLLESDSGKSYRVFRSWGRVGTSIGGTKIEKFYSIDSAVLNFRELYLEKTGNEFGTKIFKKHPRKFYPLEIDYGEQDEKFQDLQSAGSGSKLSTEVQNIIKMIFDIESMKRAMVEFEIDLNKMPLGKLSKQQMQKAYGILTEATALIEKGVVTGPKIVDCSNKFYTLIPHDFGMKQPPFLDNIELIKSKVEMINNLLDIEVAYNLLQGDEPAGVKKEPEELDPLDFQYKKLQCDIEPLDKSDAMYETILKMVENTHAKTHSWYDLEVEQIFAIDRKGEQGRYRPFNDLHNRRLLWHGSRVTNYAGILSQGLRIAPPEAPVTGYMFGKGIYFADMVSKSANYCYPSHSNPTGLLLLAEVALGNMYELKYAKDVRKLPKGKHSVKGVGCTAPDRSADVVTKDGTVAHTGVGVNTKTSRTSLLYNEFIIYDNAQVKLKYLVKAKFNMESEW